MKAYLILEDGEILQGTAFGAERETYCELVFNTSMAGYVEVLTDPSYFGQGVVMAYPIIGNYGMSNSDLQSAQPRLSAFFVREFSDFASNFRHEIDIAQYLDYHSIPGMQGIDTRSLVRKLRKSGSMNCMLTYDEINICGDRLRENLAHIRAYSIDDPIQAVSSSTTMWQGEGGAKIALLDLGAVNAISANVLASGNMVKILNCQTSAKEILKSSPDGVIISNGPGDPSENHTVLQTAKELYDFGIPIFAICLGHLTLAASLGCGIKKLKFGHHGANHPVKDHSSGLTYITSQNHIYCLDEREIIPAAQPSMTHLNDSSIEGLTYKNKKVVSTQFRPAIAGGSPETAFLFDEFLSMIGG